MQPRQMVGRLSHLAIDERVQPGYVGSNYAATGLLLLGINPAADTAGESSENVYEAIAKLDGTVESFQAYNAAIAELLLTWPIYLNVVKPLMDKCNLTTQDFALLNLLPLRADKTDRGRMFDVAWHNATSKQVTALTPKRIVCLGQESFDFVSPMWKDTRVYCIRRTASDRTNLTGYQNTLADIERIAWYVNPGTARTTD